MKSIVIYFSQTGNTEKIAKCIQNGIIQAAGSCDIIEMRDANPLHLKKYDLIGLGSMVMGAAPANVIEFVDKMRYVGGKHFFTFCTHGTSYGRYVSSLYPNIKKRGLVLIGSSDWYADCFLLHMAQPYPTAGHPDEIDFKEAEDFGREMVVRSQKISAGQKELIPPPPGELAPFPGMGAPQGGKAPAGGPPGGAPPPGAPNMGVIGTFSARLKYYKEKCLYPGCTLCQDNCPVFGIDLSVAPPILAKPCLDCEFCARLCPTKALDMDEWVKQMIEMTGNLPRSPKLDKAGHPLLTNLEKDEASGHFRRKIPLDQVKMEVSGYKVYTKHPQWIIGKGPNK